MKKPLLPLTPEQQRSVVLQTVTMLQSIGFFGRLEVRFQHGNATHVGMEQTRRLPSLYGEPLIVLPLEDGHANPPG